MASNPSASVHGDVQAESSVRLSYPSVSFSDSMWSPMAVPPRVLPPVPVAGPARSKKVYELAFTDGTVAVSCGMMTRLCQEGHIFKMLLFGGRGFRDEVVMNPIEKLKRYGVTSRAFRALVFGLRTNDASAAYKYRLEYDAIGGFKNIDKYHMKRLRMKRSEVTADTSAAAEEWGDAAAVQDHDENALDLTFDEAPWV